MSGLQRFVGGGTAAPAPEAPALRRFVQPRARPAPGEACELCAEPVADDHSHCVDADRRSLLCVCRACYLLFTRPGAAQGRYRAVGDRHRRIEPFNLTPIQWTSLQIPVGMAFFLADSRAGRTVAFYPSPAGATESLLDLGAWGEIVAANPAMSEVQPDVEAILIRHDDEHSQCFIVPVDRCYELVGALRLHWRGFDGGLQVREQIAAFFADVAQRSRPRSRR